MLRECLPQSVVTIKSIEGDGNCLFRAVSYQLYNTTEYHQIIRSFCMDLIEIDKESYSDFIHEYSTIEKYIKEKRKLGVWGDNIEIQALSELYQIPIYIYHVQNYDSRSQSLERLNFETTLKNENFNFLRNESCFYEVVCKIFPRNMEEKDVSLFCKNEKPIRLLYHEEVHYDSLHYTKDNSDPIICFRIGTVESRVISNKKKKLMKDEKVKNKKTHLKSNTNINLFDILKDETVVSNSSLNPKLIHFEYETGNESSHSSFGTTNMKNVEEVYYSEFYSTDKEFNADCFSDDEMSFEELNFKINQAHKNLGELKHVYKNPAHLTILKPKDKLEKNQANKFISNNKLPLKSNSNSRKKCVAISCPTSNCKH